VIPASSAGTTIPQSRGTHMPHKNTFSLEESQQIFNIY
jgi:hypothetical protein